MMPLDLPPTLHERVVCSIAAATKYEIPVNALLAVAEVEGGKPGQWVRNANGTHDVGAMQFNTAYLKTLSKYGIGAEHVAAPGCYPYELAAWRLRQHVVNDSGEFWSRIANYHSRTPKYNQIYRAKLVTRAAKWGDWLQKRFGVGQTQPVPVVQVASATMQPATTSKPARAYVSGYVPRQIAVIEREPIPQDSAVQ